MKTFFWLIVIIVIMGIIFLFANSLRCYSKRSVLVCPDMCLSDQVKCDSELEPGCDELFNCKSPKLENYPEYFQNILDDAKQKLIK
ncbi:MAG: hypothetical protein ABIG10_01670 [bacterium]